MKLHLQTDSAVTLVENIFIDQYMPAANGEFVKLYLYLLRCAGTDTELSVSSIADFFNHTEKDVKRALTYWEKQGLLRLTCDERKNLTDILLLPCHPAGDASNPALSQARLADASLSSLTSSRQTEASVSNLTGSQVRQEETPVSSIPPAAQNPSEGQPQIPEKRSLSPARRKKLAQEIAITDLIHVEETYLRRPLNPSEISNLMYFYDCLHFSQDLIEYLIEYCITITGGKPGTQHYIEKVAQEWYLSGIKTAAAAKQSSVLYSKDHYTILKRLGLSSHRMAPAEKEFIDRWLEEYKLPVDLICEACDRAVKAQKSGFSYIDSILKSWHDHDVKTMEDILRLDQEHARSKNSASKVPAKAEKAGGGKDTASAKTGSGNRFNQFSQRDYDWKDLEQKLAASSAKEQAPESYDWERMQKELSQT